MKKMICVTNEQVAEKLNSLGYRYMVQYVNDRKVFTFVESEDLFVLLNDKKQFDKKHWYTDRRLRF